MINWLVRLFGAAFVRKLAYLLAALLFVSVGSLLGVGNARAGTDSHPTSSEAGAHCNSVVAGNVAALCATMVDRAPGNSYCIATTSPARFQEQGQCLDSNPSNGTASPYTFSAAQLNYHTWTTNNCPSQAPANNWVVGETNVCHDGCEFTPDPNAVISGYAATGQVCTSNGNKPVIDADTDGDGITDSRDLYPNDPNESSDGDGDGTGDNGDFSPDDPDNGADDGTGDNEDDNVSSGGGDCGTPPVSSGDGITSQIAYQTWHTRCAQISGNAIAEAQKDLLEAIQAGQAAAATGTKQDQVRAEIQTTNARLSLLQAQNALSIAETTAAINNFAAQQGTEVTATQNMLDQIRAKYGDEAAATRVRIDALNNKLADEQAATRQHLTDLGVIDQAKQDAIVANTAKIEELKDHSADLVAQLQALNTTQTDSKGFLGNIKDGIAGILDKLTNGTLKTECVKNATTGLCEGMPLGGGDGLDLTETNGLLEQINESGAGMMEFFTGIDPLDYADTAEMDAVTGEQAFGEDVEYGAEGFDDTGFGWSRSCPAPVTFDVLGHAFSLDTAPMCNWLQLGGWFVLLLAAWRCIKAVAEA